MGSKVPVAFVFLVSLLPAVQAQAAEAPRFNAETESSGIVHRYDGGFFYMAGAGVAVFDCDGDEFTDLFLAGGTNPAQLYRNTGRHAGPLKFEPATDSGVSLTGVTGAYPLDIDGDGETDLAVLRVGENKLMRGLGNCRFEPANKEWEFDGGDGWTTAFSATWEKGRAWPTLAVGNFMDRETVIMDYGDCDRNRLFRPRRDGGYGEPVALDPGHCPLSMLFSDWNRDGVQELRISNDKEFYRGGQEQLFRLNEDGPGTYGEGDGWRPVNIWGMGIASSDITGDGYPEYYLTNMINNRFEVLEADAERPAYTDRAGDFGIEAAYPFIGGDLKPSTAWHAEFGDVNNDGRADLLVVKGNVEVVRMNADVDPNNLLIQQDDGTFREGAVEAGVVSFELGRGGALADFNNDGMLDLVISNRFAPVEIWRNVGDGSVEAPHLPGNWLRLRFDTRGVNQACVGCWVEVRTPAGVQRREITVGGGHAGGQWGWLHFGLGRAKAAEARVQWRDGTWGDWLRIEANRSATIFRDANQVTY